LTISTARSRSIPAGTNYLAARGDVFNAKGELDRAIADYDRALTIAPNDKFLQSGAGSRGGAGAVGRLAAATAQAAQQAIRAGAGADRSGDTPRAGWSADCRFAGGRAVHPAKI